MNARNTRHVKLASQAFRVLSDETRLRLLLALRGGEKNVTELCQELKLRQPAVSHHLGLLRMQGLVQNRRAGKLVYYAVDAAQQQLICKAIAAVLGC